MPPSPPPCAAPSPCTRAPPARGRRWGRRVESTPRPSPRPHTAASPSVPALAQGLVWRTQLVR
eukprot:2609990-Pyramimonas_sp.AAC.1